MDPRIVLGIMLGIPIVAPNSCDQPTTVVPDEPEPDWEDWDDDDDDDIPEYDELIDMEQANLEAWCEAITADDEEGMTPTGTFYFHTDFDGWADDCWMELWDLTTPYCEGWDPHTGEPCKHEDQIRPGWYMDNTDFGYSPEHGFWDEWELTLDYVQTWPPEPSASHFTCEEADAGLVSVRFCCVDFNEVDDVQCAEFQTSSW